MEKKIIEEKENMKVQQAAFDKILPGVQARCAVFYFKGKSLLFFSKVIPPGKKQRSAPGPLGDFCIVSFKNSVSFYFVKKNRKLPSILYDNCL